jgi:hypothetical protein
MRYTWGGVGLLKAFIYSDKSGMKSVRFLLFFAVLAHFENAHASDAKRRSCFDKVWGASRAFGKAAGTAAKSTGTMAKEIGKGIQGYGQEVKDTKGMRLLVNDLTAEAGVEERWHGVWRRRTPTDAAGTEIVEGASPVETAVDAAAGDAAPKSLSQRVGGSYADARKKINDTVQAKPRAWSRNLFQKDGEP